MHKIIMDLIPNDWKHIATLNWNFSKTPLKFFCYNNKGTRKVKVFLKLSNKDTLQQTFQIYIPWPNIMDGRKPYSQSWYWEKILDFSLIGLSNIMVEFFLSGINLSIFLPLNPAIYGIGNAPKIVRNQMSLTPSPHFSFYCKIWTTKS